MEKAKKVLKKISTGGGISPQRTRNPLKAEIVELAVKIQDNEDEEALKRAIQVLKNVIRKIPNETIPEDFKCFISKEVMQDPVIIETGYTYERRSIVDYLRENGMCPMSKKKIENKNLMVPNLALKEQISDWRMNNGVVAPKTETELQIELLTKNFPKGILQLRQICVKDLVCYTNRGSTHYYFRGLKEPIKLTLSALLENFEDPEYHVDLATLILNLSEIEDLGRAVGESRNVIPFLIESLKEGKPIDANIKACQILMSLSQVESNLEDLVNSETTNAVLRLFSKSDTIAVVDTVVTTLTKLCGHESFFQAAIDEGMHRFALQKLKNRPVNEVKILQILTLFLESPEILMELIRLNAAPVLMSMVMKLNGGTEEPALDILYAMCEVDAMFEEEGDLIKSFRGDVDALGEWPSLMAQVLLQLAILDLHPPTPKPTDLAPCEDDLTSEEPYRTPGEGTSTSTLNKGPHSRYTVAEKGKFIAHGSPRME